MNETDSREIELEHEKILEEADFISKNFEDTMTQIKEIIADITFIDTEDASPLLTPRTEKLIDEKIIQEIQSLSPKKLVETKSSSTATTTSSIQHRKTSPTLSASKSSKPASVKSSESKKIIPPRNTAILPTNTKQTKCSPTRPESTSTTQRPKTASKSSTESNKSSQPKNNITTRPSSAIRSSTTISSIPKTTTSTSNTSLVEVLLQKLHLLGPILTQISSILLLNHSQLIDESTLKLLTLFHKYENREQNSWIHSIQSLLQNQFIQPPQTNLFKQLVHTPLQQTLQQCTLLGLLCPKIAILAVEKAGKTSVLYETVMLCGERCIATGQWLTHFFFVLNWKYFVEMEMDLEQFICNYICHVLYCLVQQRSEMISYLTTLQQFFCCQLFAPKYRMPSKPLPMEFVKKYSRQSLFFQQWIGQLKKCWDEFQFEKVIEQILMSPRTLTELFGFEKVVCVFDNFEFANITLCEYTSSHRITKPLHKILKKVLESEYFIVSGKPQPLETVLWNAASPTSEVDWFSVAQLVCLDQLIDTNQLSFPNQSICIQTSDGSMCQEVPIELFKGNPGFLCHILERQNNSIPVTSEFITQLQQWITQQQLQKEKKKEDWEYNKQNSALLQCMIYSLKNE